MECAEEERRVVLTSDRAFIARRYCEAAYFVRGPDKKSQLAEVIPQCCCHYSLHYISVKRSAAGLTAWRLGHSMRQSG